MILSDRYELLERVGRGGMGQVWEGRDARLGRRVAVKTMQLGAGSDPALTDRFRREAVATAALTHPAVITVYDAGIDDAQPGGSVAFLVMEFLEGTDLRDTLTGRGPLPLPEALHIGAEVAGGLAAAHAIGVVHRDIKPANILLHGRRVTVVDFGIAALTHSGDPTLTAPGTTLGTAAYMAPEQASGAPVTPAADVYSLGCVLWALLTGRPPFSGEHPLALLQQHAHETPPPLNELRPDAPEDLQALVAAMLAKEPAERPTAPEVADALAAIAAGLGGDTDPTVALGASSGTRVLPLPAAGAGPATPAATTSVLPTAAPTSVLPATAPTSVLPPAAVAGTAAAAAGAAAAAVAATAQLPAVGRTVPPAPGTGTPAEAPASTTGSERRPPGRRAAPVALAALAVVAIIATAFWLGRSQGEAANGASPTASPVQTATPTVSPTAGPTPTGEPTQGPASLAAALAELKALVDGLPDGSDREEDAQDALTQRWESLQEAADRGPTARVEQRLRDFVNRVDDLEKDDKLSAGDAAALRSAADGVAAALA